MLIQVCLLPLRSLVIALNTVVAVASYFDLGFVEVTADKFQSLESPVHPALVVHVQCGRCVKNAERFKWSTLKQQL